MSWLKTPWSTKRVVQRDVLAWQAENKYCRSHKLSRLEAEMLFTGEHPVQFIISLVALYLLSLSLWYVVPFELDFWRIGLWGEEGRLAHFTTLWSIQATLAALVYPIVIAFVTVFIQRQPTSSAFLHLYILNSGALVAGLSSLLLVILMGIQYVLIPTNGTTELPIWVALDAIWFSLNAVLTAMFLYRTIEFLTPDKQQEVVRQYAVSVALPSQIRRLYAFQVLAASFRQGWLPITDYFEDKDKKNGSPKLMLGPYAFSDGAPQGNIAFAQPARLVNVRLWFLRYVVQAWASLVRKNPQQTNISEPHRRKDETYICIPFTLNAVYAKDSPVAFVNNGPNLTLVQRRILRLAFSFDLVGDERHGIALKEILEEMQKEACSAVRRKDYEDFSRSYGAIQELHELLIGASLYRQDDGSYGSWAMLPDVNNYMNRSLHEEWSSVYRTIFEAALEVIDYEPRFAIRLAYFVNHLNGPELEDSPIEMKRHLLEYAPVLMYELSVWWGKKVEDQGFDGHNAHKMATLRAPSSSIYIEVLGNYVGAWEGIRNGLAKVPEKEDFKWINAAHIGQLCSTHIYETARMLVSAVHRGDRAAAEWFADSLDKWWGNLAYESEPFPLYGKNDFVTVEELSLSWQDALGTLALAEADKELGAANEQLLQWGYVRAAVKNYWIDMRLLTICLLIDWSVKEDELVSNDSLAIRIINGFFSTRSWKGGGEASERLHALPAPQLLLAMSRQTLSSNAGYRAGYVGRLSTFVNRAQDLKSEEMIGSRIYSRSGSDDVDSLQESYLILLTVLSGKPWKVGDSLRRQLNIWREREFQSFDRLRGRVDRWHRRLIEDNEFAQRTTAALLQGIGDELDVPASRKNATEGVADLLGTINAARAEILESEPIDPERLLELARYASRAGFSGSSGSFPMQLFSSIETRDDGLDDFEVQINQIHKGELTRTPVEQRASNEAEYFAESISRSVGSVVLFDVLQKTNFDDVQTSEPMEYWNELKLACARLEIDGKSPILFLGSSSRPEWAWEWFYGTPSSKYPRPSDLSVAYRDGNGTGYICHFNDIPVYVAQIPQGESLVLTEEAFERVKFKSYGPGLYVSVAVKEESKNGNLVNLGFSFSRQVELGYTRGVRIRYLAR
jgi:hypothetical protein